MTKSKKYQTQQKLLKARDNPKTLKEYAPVVHWVKHKPRSYQMQSSSSCRATSSDIPDPLSLLLPIVHRL